MAFLFSTGDAASSVRPKTPGERVAMSNIDAVDLAGRPWRLADHRGKVVLVNFWATWCPPCRAETPALVRIANAYRSRGVEFVGISMDEGPDEVRRFVEKYRVPYSIILPPSDSPLANAVEALPTSYLIDREGRVAAAYSGAIRESELTRAIDDLLPER